MIKVLLASASPRRQMLLKSIFSEFDVISLDIDESVLPDAPSKYVSNIALKKLEAVKSLNYDLIITADTTVFLGNVPIGKPKDKLDAFNILNLLNNKTHQVITAVALKCKDKILVQHEITDVTFKNLDENTINCYINTHNIMDKAGAYGIQDNVVVKEYIGDYNNIVGLPIDRIKKMLKELDVI